MKRLKTAAFIGLGAVCWWLGIQMMMSDTPWGW